MSHIIIIEQQATDETNINDISNIKSTESESKDGFEYPKKSKAYKKMIQDKRVQILKREPSSASMDTTSATQASNHSAQPNDSEALTSERRDAKDGSTSIKIPIQESSIPILIGTRGRNISLLCKHSMVHSSIEADSSIVFTPKSDKSDLDLAHRMMLSMVAGGVVRWFTHPSVTQKYYHASTRAELEQLVSATSQCSLALLRAHNGHLCLIIIPTKEANKEYVAEQIRNLRSILCEKISQNAQGSTPSTNDPTYDAGQLTQ